MSETIGQRLKNAREYRHITLEKAGEFTRIRPQFLRALEEDDYSNIVSAAQARGFLRNYAEYLGLNIEELLAGVGKKGDSSVDHVLKTDAAKITGPLERVEAQSTRFPGEEKRKEVGQSLSLWDRALAWMPFSGKHLVRSAEQTKVQKAEMESEEASRAEATPLSGSDSLVNVQGEQAKQGSKFGQRGKRTSKSAKSIQRSHTKVENQSTKKKIEKPVNPATFQPGLDAKEASAQHGEILAPDRTQPVSEPASITKEESQPSLLGRIKSLFMLRLARPFNQQEPRMAPMDDKSSFGAGRLTPATTAASEKSANQLFAEIGSQLHERRNLLSLTLEEIENHTRIRAVYLKAMETGAFEQLPSPVQTRGLLANYASFLDLDTERLMLQFADVLQARHRQKYPEIVRMKSPVQASPSIPTLRSFIASDVLFGVGVIVIIAGLTFWGVGRLLNPPAVQQSIESTAPSIAEVLAGTSVASLPQEVTLIPAQDTPLSELEATQANELVDTTGISEVVNVQVTISAVARAFLRVKADGVEVFNDTVLPGNVYPFEADDQIEVLTGNGAAMRVSYNGRELGLMGSLGEVIDRIYTTQGIATATPTLAPTATATAPISPTVTSTSTPAATPTR